MFIAYNWFLYFLYYSNFDSIDELNQVCNKPCYGLGTPSKNGCNYDYANAGSATTIQMIFLEKDIAKDVIAICKVYQAKKGLIKLNLIISLSNYNVQN